MPAEKNPSYGDYQGTPAAAYTVHPRELAFYRFHIESLQASIQAINAISTLLWHVDLDTVSDQDDPPGWWSQRISGGLLLGIMQLSHSTTGPLEFMLKRIEEFHPSNSEN